MRNTISFLFILISSILMACKPSGKPSNLLTEMHDCDSAAIMYYHTPGDPRFFSVVKLYDKPSLSRIAADVNGPLNTLQKDTCTSQGKVYYYGKGDAVYVAYFSRQEDCLLFSFIKTGEKYFTRMSAASKDLLDKMEKEAKEPSPVSVLR